MLTSSGGAEDAKPASPLDGKWVYEAQTIGGSALTKADREAIWVEIKAGSFFRCGQGGGHQESRLTLGPAGAPNEFALTFKHPITGKVSRSKGIFKVDGDRLTLCYDNSGKTRPAKFDSPEGRDEIVLSVLRRSKK